MWKLHLALAGAGLLALWVLWTSHGNERYNAGYQQARLEIDNVTLQANRDIAAKNAEFRRNAILREGRLNILSIDALTGVSDIPQCSVSQCALPERSILKLREMRQ
jgi:hypothetical protein